MKLDNEKQREALLGLIAASGFPGTAIDDVYALKQAIANAALENDDGDQLQKTLIKQRRDAMTASVPQLLRAAGEESEGDV